ncbi:MAG: AlpA family phage regulatory protein [Propionivibrio sp.]|nr:AlpA family phage regulatory protein [Propionivibrio sp.]
MQESIIVTSPATLTLPKEGYARLRQVLTVIPVSRSSWYAGVKAGKYPQSVKLGPRTTAWKVSEIRALIDAA